MTNHLLSPPGQAHVTMLTIGMPDAYIYCICVLNCLVSSRTT